MRRLPENGLIVSCYLESMRGSEKEFISAVAHAPGVMGLRVEGLDNIEHARKIAPDTWIVGLIKEFDGFRNLITPDLPAMGRAIIHAGADIVAAERVSTWTLENPIIRVDGLGVPFKVMWDLKAEDFESDGDGDVRTLTINEADACRIRQMALREEIVLATTFIPKAFPYAHALRYQFPNVKINLEGGIETAEEYAQAFVLGANYVTIGKAINDPRTIIETILKKDN